ncbi:DUF4189 domain-containing protein [Ralstonia insidiosa]|uniref:DUF4189 domain-containing protein n=1 Tax=Ralstonia insidiosa TaxID=190721 RepID=A0A848P919_9RALS|nr:DUF4189 domain-containing protein [Ralstonia insidiosa]NMV41957.1 DUF4189 domain-containing protein [Ralstonia insidiosa]
MKRSIAVEGFHACVALFFGTGFLAQPAFAEVSVARGNASDYFYAIGSDSVSSERLVLNYCKKEGVSGCKVIARSKRGSQGYGALAESKARYGVTTGYRSLEAAKESALDACVKLTSTDDTCRITMTFHDDSHGQRSGSEGVPRDGGVRSQLMEYACAPVVRTLPRLVAEQRCDFSSPMNPTPCHDEFVTKWEDKLVNPCTGTEN